MDKKFPKIGVGVMIIRDSKILLGLRQGSHGSGEWSFPGGHLDFGETIFQTAKREVLEEVGLKVEELELFSVSDDFRYIKSDGKHHVTIGVLAHSSSGDPELLEPEKCLEWKFFSFEELPENLFESTRFMIDNYLSKSIYKENLN